MLRQLARLTLSVDAAGERARAIAVYADAADRRFAAADRGFEGVACVDDAARALVMLCDVWKATDLEPIRQWAASLLDFVLYMQLDDGRFVNFIADWSGERNERGVTSFPGGGFWHARGTRSLARAWLVLGDDRARRALERALPHVREAHEVPPDVRAIHVLMALELVRAERMPELLGELERWCDEIASMRRDGVLFDNPDQVAPHLWAHQQEGVLAEAAAFIGRDDLIAVARRSALAYLAPIIGSGFDEPMVQPYGVASAIHSVERLAAVTRDPVFDDLWRKARAWFDGRNPAGAPVYDADAGRVYDGIDEGVVNPHSGAESNVVGAQALIDRVIATAPRLMPAIEACLRSGVERRVSVTLGR
ncbi:MAG TPA: hypothetical protein VGQ86_06480 [Candidatus Limnocylindria bacterium]|nr:hypothetical protein [Candidatus Limnocylindria bacterium]